MNFKNNFMKTIFVFALSIACFSGSGQTAGIYKKLKTDSAMTYTATFQIKKCDKIILRYYKKMSDSRDGVTTKSKEITDKVILQKILLLLKQLPDKGDMMIKMGDVPILEVLMTIDKGETVYFTFYDKMIKAPDTSFYSGTAPAEEKKLFDLLTSILNK